MEQEVTFIASRHADPGEAYWRQRAHVEASADRLATLRRAVASDHDLSAPQWAQLFALAVDYAPDLIVELGRQDGNSTCVFTEAAHGTSAHVVSLCLSPRWRTLVRPRLDGHVPDAWFAPLDAREGNLIAADLGALVASAHRVLVFWDAHGFAVAQHVLANLLPALAGREHVVILHDLSDARGRGENQDYYGDRPLWKGNDWSGPRLRIGHIDTSVEQGIAAVDFTSRHRLTLESADERIRQRIGRDQEAVREMTARLGEFFSLEAHWFYFSLNERQGIFTFPAPVPFGAR